MLCLALFFSMLAGTGTGAAEGTGAFWVWNRRVELSSEERQLLASMNATLFWHVGELDLRAGREPLNTEKHWQWRASVPEGEGVPVIEVVPVVRLNLSPSANLRGQELISELAGFANPKGYLEIDYDCPDSLLGEYADFLRALRKRVPHLSATALGGWSHNSAFGILQESVEGLEVMFYDLAPDMGPISATQPPRPLLDPVELQNQLQEWSRCKIPWRAGVPNFCRLTVFDPEGKSLGHIRKWTWDDVIFQPSLKLLATSKPGVVLMKATKNFILAGTPIAMGSLVAFRWVDKKALITSLNLVRNSAARGPIFFRLSDSSDLSGWSLEQLGQILMGGNEQPSAHLRLDGERFVLENTSRADYPPTVQSDALRGYALEVEISGEGWREAIAGEFWRVGAHANPEKAPVPVPVALASRLTFWFSSLRAGKSIKSGLIQFAPGTDLHQIRYRILPGDNQWKSLE